MWPNKQFQYPVREAFRFHFDEPPAAPLRHEETKRVRKIMHWDTPPNRGAGMNSERTELDYQMASDLVRKDAPFGNDDTLCATVKIVGGKQQYFMEQHPKNNQSGGSRIQILRPIADKPNHLDPRFHGDNPGGYYNKDVQPTAYVNRRPDSKDVVRGQLRALPPIQQNRTRNDMSTVFESEPWIRHNENPSLANDTEYKQNYFPGREHEHKFEYNNQSGRGHEHSVSEYDRQQLIGLVPPNVLLPNDPISLSREQEVSLCKLICTELRDFNPKELKEVYVECSHWDKNLEGYCTLEVLDQKLRDHKAYLSETLRPMAAQFVDPRRPGYVNYEKSLSFIGSALKLNEKGQLYRHHNSREKNRDRDSREGRQIGQNRSHPSTSYSSLERMPLRQRGISPTRLEEPELEKRSDEKHQKYFKQNGDVSQPVSIYTERELAKTLRTIEQELTKNSYSFNSSQWEKAFQRMDREFRGTLSAAQIKDITYDLNLPLSDSLINKILQHSETGNRDGQYKWEKFLKFLERLRPTNTGLPIPVSKRPLEYAKHYPEPVPNWPHAETVTERRGTSPRKEYGSPLRGDIKADDRVQSPVKQPSPSNDRNNIQNTNGQDRRKRESDASSPRGYYDRSPDSFRDRRYNSPDPHDRFKSPTRDKNGYYDRLEKRYTYPINGYNDYDRYENRKHDTDRYNEPDRYRRSRKDRYDAQSGTRYPDEDDKRRSYAEDPRSYVPSWQYDTQYKSSSPPPPRRIHERDTFKDDRTKDSAYERHWRKWAYKSDRESKAACRAPSNYSRPNSYIEPQRSQSQQPSPDPSRRRPFSYREDLRFDSSPVGRSQSRIQGPVSRQESPIRRVRSLSPLRQPSTTRYKSYPKTYREPYADPYPGHSKEQYPLDSEESTKQQKVRFDRDRDTYRRDRRENSYRDGYRQDGDRGDGTNRSRKEQMDQLSHQIKDLEMKYQVTKDGLRSNEKPWKDRFLLMAQALYNSDISNKGSLPQKDVHAIVEQYNSAFNLDLDMNRVRMMYISPENLDKSNNIILRSFLVSLTADRTA